MTEEEIINDEEWLYRSFPVPDPRQNGEIHYKIIDGVLRFGRGAWNDSRCQPSVDRKKLVSCPNDVKFNEQDVVIQIQAKEILTITVAISGTDNINHTHNVIFSPEDGRPAHSLITSFPQYLSKPNSEKTKWREFQELLALASAKHGWVIEPSGE